ncbi:MAG TPA: hypothetical protein VL137_09050 [Polyangiaceae bacterium]|nr:hypothetical protein [Polyangiaceae bacterium]
MRARSSLLLIAALAGFACASPPPPRSLADVDTLAHSPRGQESKAIAPQAYLHAQELAAQAHAAHDHGNDELASLLAEQASAQLQQAFVLTRASKASERQKRAAATVDQERTELAAIEAQQAELTAQTEALELRARVIRDAVAPIPSGKASADREQARHEAALALLTDARLLCIAAELLHAEPEAPRKQLENIGALEKETALPAHPAPIDGAVRARATCLSLLSAVRQGAAAKESAQPSADTLPGDALLDELSRAGYSPQRDDRGVVVVLHDAFQGNALSKGAQQKLSEIAHVATAHAQYPLLLVLHSAKGKPTAADSQRMTAAQAALTSGGLHAPQGELAGGNQPLVPSSQPGAAGENARLEVIFVTPSW